MTRRRKSQAGKNALNTADHLARAVFDDLLPTHPQTCKDYGFDRAVTRTEKCYLLGLYGGLIKFLEVSPKTIHDWRVRGVLVTEIKAAYHKIPRESWSGYFCWFLQNEDIVALAGKPLSAKEIRDHGETMLLRSWRFTGGNERDTLEDIRAAVARKPVEEQKSHLLYTLLASMCPPSPDLDIWIDFGFASCMSEVQEVMLCADYLRLITACTFQEFCDAYRNRRLLDLFQSKGLQVYVTDQLRDLLSSDLPAGWRKSSWDLKQFVLREGTVGMIPSITVDYGFANCSNASELQRLKVVYWDFFVNHRGDPLALHQAAIKGNLYGYLSTIVQSCRGAEFRRLMKNPYPLPDLVDMSEPPSRSWFSGWRNPTSVVDTKVALGAGLGGVLVATLFMFVL